MACRKTSDWGGGGKQQKFTDRLLNAPELPAIDDRLPTRDDRKAYFYLQAIELPTASTKVKGV